MTTSMRAWRPLHLAIAWALTRDEDFVQELDAESQRDYSPLAAAYRLEAALVGCDCFTEVEQTRTGFSETFIEHVLIEGYDGRFSDIAAGYEGQRFNGNGRSLCDFLLSCWMEFFDRIRDAIADGRIAARGLVVVDGGPPQEHGVLPPECLSGSSALDADGFVCPQLPCAFGPQPNRWKHVEVAWKDIEAMFLPTSHDPESRCRLWLTTEVRKSPHLRPAKRDDFRIEAKRRFPELTDRAFGRAWTEATSGTPWDKPGRPSKNPSKNPVRKINRCRLFLRMSV